MMLYLSKWDYLRSVMVQIRRTVSKNSGTIAVAVPETAPVDGTPLPRALPPSAQIHLTVEGWLPSEQQ